ncbi:DUF4345 domain-containing protein, partial [Photobacterium sp. ZSDE20]|nr:DUF4345 domain-containing protein [Photobacterium sp. ZSDE20]
IFMLGLAAGRLTSIIFDGMPHWLLFIYLLLEIGFGVVALKMINLETTENTRGNR